jgi:sec-independent protein translocase protein TatB
MLDFGFSEILLTSAIALVVLGPEKLPKVARQVGNWMGRARMMARQLSEQLEREVNAEELLRQSAKLGAQPPLPPDPKPAMALPPVAAPATAPEPPPLAEVPRVPHPTSAAAMHPTSAASMHPTTQNAEPTQTTP